MKPQQMLIDDSGRAMVNDFNSAHIMDEHPWLEGEFCPVKSAKSARLVPWRSPENNEGKVRHCNTTADGCKEPYSCMQLFIATE